MRDTSLGVNQTIPEEDESGLYSPLKFEKDENGLTQYTHDSTAGIPFLEAERKLSLFQPSDRTLKNKIFLFGQPNPEAEQIKNNLKKLFNWSEEKDEVFLVRKTISLDKQLLRNSYEEQ